MNTPEEWYIQRFEVQPVTSNKGDPHLELAFHFQNGKGHAVKLAHPTTLFALKQAVEVMQAWVNQQQGANT